MFDIGEEIAHQLEESDKIYLQLQIYDFMTDFKLDLGKLKEGKRNADLPKMSVSSNSLSETDNPEEDLDEEARNFATNFLRVHYFFTKR